MFVPQNTPGRIKVYEQKHAIEKKADIGSYYLPLKDAERLKGFEVSPGDIIVSCAGTIGEIYKLPKDAEAGIINQALMRVKLFGYSFEAFFLLYFDHVLRRQAAKEGNGTGMKNIPPFSVLKAMMIPLPPIQEQNRIISKLSECLLIISGIASLNHEVMELGVKLRRRILNSVFSSDKSYYPKVKLGDALHYLQPGPYIVNNTEYAENKDEEHSTPVLTPGKSFVLGYTNEKHGIYVPSDKVIIFDDFTTASRLVDFPFKVKSSAMKILVVTNPEKFSIAYLFNLLQTIHPMLGTHKRFWISEFSVMSISAPPIDIQRRKARFVEEYENIISRLYL